MTHHIKRYATQPNRGSLESKPTTDKRRPHTARFIAIIREHTARREALQRDNTRNQSPREGSQALSPHMSPSTPYLPTASHSRNDSGYLSSSPPKLDRAATVAWCDRFLREEMGFDKIRQDSGVGMITTPELFRRPNLAILKGRPITSSIRLKILRMVYGATDPPLRKQEENGSAAQHDPSHRSTNSLISRSFLSLTKPEQRALYSSPELNMIGTTPQGNLVFGEEGTIKRFKPYEYAAVGHKERMEFGTIMPWHVFERFCAIAPDTFHSITLLLWDPHSTTDWPRDGRNLLKPFLRGPCSDAALKGLAAKLDQYPAFNAYLRQLCQLWERSMLKLPSFVSEVHVIYPIPFGCDVRDIEISLKRMHDIAEFTTGRVVHFSAKPHDID